MKEDPDLADGRVAIVHGVTGDESHRYLLRNLSILQPASVTLLSRATSPTLEVTLHSPGWKDTVRVAALDGEPARTLKFRTQGDVGISVRSSDGRSQQFDLVAWVGSEVEPRIEEAVVSPEEFARYAAANPDAYPGETLTSAGGGDSPVLLAIAVALSGIFVMLAILVFRKVRS